ncbi:MAG: 6-phosphogluconolactonase [Candidatus Pacebacteria bacterium]|nr:6-phosphogluconolactonase [Candidatus Paceibacterota bacterium]
MNIHRFSTDILAFKTAISLNKSFKACGGKPFLFLSSGGSSLSTLEHIDTDLFTIRSTLAVLDERHSHDPEVNNLAQIEKTLFYKKIRDNGCHIIDTRPLKMESAEDVALRFEKQLREWAVTHPNGIIIASAGIGADAHTSGIMPYPEDHTFFSQTFDETTNWVASYDATGKNPHSLRVTTTFTFLRKINYTVLFMSGTAKESALDKLLAPNGSLADSPCRIWREVENVELFTDIQVSR